MKTKKTVKFYEDSTSPSVEREMTFSIYDESTGKLYAKIGVVKFQNDQKNPYAVYLLIEPSEELSKQLIKDGFKLINSIQNFCSFKYESDINNINSAIKSLKKNKILESDERDDANKFINDLDLALDIVKLQLDELASKEECIKSLKTDIGWKFVLSNTVKMTQNEFFNFLKTQPSSSEEKVEPKTPQ